MQEILDRIREGLESAASILKEFTPGKVRADDKGGGDPVTEADRRVDSMLRGRLPRPGEGWLSEETADDPSRLRCRAVWIVDPLDGTREFVQGIPEWCVSIAYVLDGRPVAGGIHNPATDEWILGSEETGVLYNGEPAVVRERRDLEGARVLASRSETGRGEWKAFEGRGFEIVPMGSVAYKLCQVAAGRADATWTLVPKHEWDIAAGAALVTAAGGEVYTLACEPPQFNRKRPKVRGLVAHGKGLGPAIRSLLDLPR